MSIERWQFEAEDGQQGIIHVPEQLAAEVPMGYLMALLGFSLTDVRPADWLIAGWLIKGVYSYKGRSPLFDDLAEGSEVPVYTIEPCFHDDDGMVEDSVNVKPGHHIELHIVVPDGD